MRGFETEIRKSERLRPDSEKCCRSRCSRPPKRLHKVRQLLLPKTASLPLLFVFLRPRTQGVVCPGKRRRGRMLAHIRGCDAKSARRVDPRQADEENAGSESHPCTRGRSAPNHSLTQPYMFTIGTRTGQRRKTSGIGAECPRFSQLLERWMQANLNIEQRVDWDASLCSAQHGRRFFVLAGIRGPAPKSGLNKSGRNGLLR